MICLTEASLRKAAANLPISYLSDCRAVAKVNGNQWCFSLSDYQAIRQKYRGFAVSEADRYREGEIISGCCDRADQY
jgi:hypothetical protein